MRTPSVLLRRGSYVSDWLVRIPAHILSFPLLERMCMSHKMAWSIGGAACLNTGSRRMLRDGACHQQSKQAELPACSWLGVIADSCLKEGVIEGIGILLEEGVLSIPWHGLGIRFFIILIAAVDPLARSFGLQTFLPAGSCSRLAHTSFARLDAMFKQDLTVSYLCSDFRLHEQLENCDM